MTESKSRVGHYVSPNEPIGDVKCSCGKAFKTHYADESWIATMLNAAIAHGIDVERGRNGV